jgi:HAE1 family hydrophobic/amphiphilic exporter-1
MTSLAFFVGLLPLALATGAGATGNRTIGTAAAGGMAMGTVWGVLIVPGLYVLAAACQDFFGAKPTAPPASVDADDNGGAHPVQAAVDQSGEAPTAVGA